MESPPVLELRGASVRFGADTVLDAFDLSLHAGEVHSLMGENGAGKSTVVKAITGVVPLAGGRLLLDGRECALTSPRDALLAGIGVVHQEVDLLANLSVAENIWLGREPHRRGVIDWRETRGRTARLLADLGVSIDPGSRLGVHPLAVQQLIAIARAMATDVRILVLDEPTSRLDAEECGELFRVLSELRERGVATLFVSHFLDQVYEICDRVSVLRDGRLAGEYRTEEVLRIELVEAMLGRSTVERPSRARLRVVNDGPDETPYLSARGVTVGNRIGGADVDLVGGEVLGVAGLPGSGRTELARAIAGIDRLDAGIIRIDGHHDGPHGPRSAISLGVVYSSENRRAEGIVAALSVMDNITLALQAEHGALHRMSTARKRELAESWVEALDIRPPDLDRPAGTLSGGNQQKVLLARLLSLAPRVLVLDEPTRGIDVGAKVDVQNLVGELAGNGMSVMFISAELEEVLRVGTRVAILADGKIVDTLPSEELTVDSLTALVASLRGLDE